MHLESQSAADTKRAETNGSGQQPLVTAGASAIELFDNGSRKWMYFGRDAKRPAAVIDTNEYLVIHESRGLLLDPGGLEIFPFVVSSITQVIELEKIQAIFASHQDPDICSSLALWVDLLPHVKVYLPWLWESFVAHFGSTDQLTPLPDEGGSLPLGQSTDLQAIPAHYLHSSGNFSVYDPTARILFSGDIGAALLPPDETDIRVSDFDQHIQYMEGFHKRWMPSNTAKQRWIERVRGLKIDMLCPQHGSIFVGKDVERFLGWFEGLNVGSGIM